MTEKSDLALLGSDSDGGEGEVEGGSVPREVCKAFKLTITPKGLKYIKSTPTTNER